MLKNIDFQGSYGIFSKTSIRKIKILKTYVCGVWCVGMCEVCVCVCYFEWHYTAWTARSDRQFKL